MKKYKDKKGIRWKNNNEPELDKQVGKHNLLTSGSKIKPLSEKIKMEKEKTLSENIIEIDGERYIKEDSKRWLDIPELNISVEIEVHDKNKSWDDLKLSKREKELLTAEQCIWLANSKYAKTLKMNGSSSKDDFFIQQPFNLSRKNGYVARFCADSGWANLYCGGVADNSDSSLGVRFLRKISKKIKKQLIK